VKPAVGFTLPSAGVTPAPGIQKIKMRDFDPVRKLILGGRSLRVRFPFPRGMGLGVRFLGRLPFLFEEFYSR
jgi:hypothetical protein